MTFIETIGHGGLPMTIDADRIMGMCQEPSISNSPYEPPGGYLTLTMACQSESEEWKIIDTVEGIKEKIEERKRLERNGKE